MIAVMDAFAIHRIVAVLVSGDQSIFQFPTEMTAKATTPLGLLMLQTPVTTETYITIPPSTQIT